MDARSLPAGEGRREGSARLRRVLGAHGSGGAARAAATGEGADGGVATHHLYPESWWPPSRTWLRGEPDTSLAAALSVTQTC